MKKTLLAALLLSSTMAMPAFAGNPDSKQPETALDSSRVYDIDEVIVVDQPKETARLRLQSLSSSSFSDGQLSSLGVEDLRDISARVPSFVMPAYGSRLTSTLYVRGIGSRINSPAVGIYVDNIPLLSKTAFNFHTYDLRRIDVLHGPQGTLYGMNAEGGIVRLYSRDPFLYQGTDIDLSVGTKFWRKAEVSHYQKLSDKTAFSLGAFYDGQNGFFRNQFSGDHADKMNEFGVKGRLMLRPTSRLSFDIMADYQYVNQNAFPYGMVVSKEDVATADITSPYYTLHAGTQDPNTNRQSNYRRNMLNTGIGIKYAGKGYTLNSMTTWQMLSDNMLMDIDYLPKDYMHVTQHQLSNALAEELSIKSHNTSFWQWTFGAFASYQWLKTEAPVYFDNDMNSQLSSTITSTAYNGMLQAMAGRMAQQMIAKGMTAEQAGKLAPIAAAAAIEKAGGVDINMALSPVPGLFHTPTFNLGVYHESNINITPNLTATLGLRYDYSHVAIDYEASAQVAMQANVMGQQMAPVITSVMKHHEHNSFNQLLPKVALMYKFHNGSNIYGVWSKGYRAGGFNIQMFSDILQSEVSGAARSARRSMNIEHDEAFYENIRNTIAYKPETSFNYEVGTHLNLFGGQVHLDLAAFYMQIHNQQLSVMAGNYGFGRMMTNAGKSHSCGLEATLRGAAFDNRLNYAVSYGFTSARFDEYNDSVTVDGVKTNVSYEDKRVPFIPEHTLAANADYRIDIDPAALIDPQNKWHFRSVTVGLNLQAQGQTYWNEANDISQNFYATLGAHADADFGPMHINLWVKNLTDTRYNTFAVQSAATGKQYTFAQLGNPFQLGVDFKFHF